jgi:hypothetical protein
MPRSHLLGIAAVSAALLAVGTDRLVAQAHTPHHPASRGAAAGGPIMGTPATRAQPAFLGYYDGRKDTYLSTDTSSKADAVAMHINYSAALGAVHGAPSIYLVEGSHVAQQIAVFGSEPGASDYSPLWQEVIVKFKAGTKPILLTSDNQILALAKKGKLSAKSTSTILNCPIVKVGK